MSLQLQQQLRPERKKNHHQHATPPDNNNTRVGFFIERGCWDGPGPAGGSAGGAGGDHQHHHQHHDADHHHLLLRQADAPRRLSSAHRSLREAVQDCLSTAMRLNRGSLRPEHLSTLVDCILHNFKKNHNNKLPPPHHHALSSSSSSSSSRLLDHGDGDGGDMFDCPSCHGFLAQPVTVACGHSYCRRCLDRRMVSSRCKVCSEETSSSSSLSSSQLPSSSSPSSSASLSSSSLSLSSSLSSSASSLSSPSLSSSSSSSSSPPSTGWSSRVNVVLGGLLDKWFPGETHACRVISRIEELSRRREHLDEAVALASRLIASAEAGPAAVVARLSRAEAYASLRQYRLALEDTDGYLSSRQQQSAEGLYQKAVILQTMGQVDESLQVFLHCLAVDQDFPHARRHVETILFDLLSPAAAGENVKVGLRETAQRPTSPRLWSKTPVVDAPEEVESLEPPEHHQSSVEVCAASAQHYPESDHHKRSGRSESLERPALSRAHSLRQTHGGFSCGGGEEGLKRVCSAPQLGDQEKGEGQLKRKLSVSDAAQGPCVVNRTGGGGSKKKQGGGVAGVSCQPPAAARACREVPQDLLDANDLECSLCMRLFYEPVTTPCGHTFCKSCLERCLDHTPQCPLCKDSLKEYLASRKYMVTRILDQLIKRYLRQEHEQRTRIHQEEKRELSDLRKNVPIFVCTMAYPTVPCPLHVFEPRYRLMIRRCMDTGTRTFGMCISDPEKGFVDHGCMLVIRSVHFLPDGRSIVDTVGGERFQVVSRGMRDGYSTADIHHLEDTRVEDKVELLGLQELHDAVYEQARVWFHGLKVRFHKQILQHFGAMPEREADIQATPNGPACCWWLLAVLPVDPRYQLSVLSMTSLRERLVKIQHILTYLQSVPDD